MRRSVEWHSSQRAFTTRGSPLQHLADVLVVAFGLGGFGEQLGEPKGALEALLVRVHVHSPYSPTLRVAENSARDCDCVVTPAGGTMGVKFFYTTVPVMDLTFAGAVVAAGQGALGAGAEVVPKGDLFARLAGSREAHKAIARALGLRDVR
jgi:hypothetical protein